MEDQPRLKIEDFFSVRTSNSLYANWPDIKYLDEINQISADEFMRYRHAGKKQLYELRTTLAKYGFSLKGEKVWSEVERMEFYIKLEKNFEKLIKKVAHAKQQIESLEKCLDDLSKKMENPK